MLGELSAQRQIHHLGLLLLRDLMIGVPIHRHCCVNTFDAKFIRSLFTPFSPAHARSPISFATRLLHIYIYIMLTCRIYRNSTNVMCLSAMKHILQLPCAFHDHLRDHVEFGE